MVCSAYSSSSSVDRKNEIKEYGLWALRPRHHIIRRLKSTHAASFHGFRLWPSSWLLIDFLSRQRLRRGLRIMEVGCGWGLAGIFCAKNHGAEIMSVDIDKEVFPFLRIHTLINHVQTTTVELGFDDVTSAQLRGVDMMIGADICFWDSLADSLRALICRALNEGVQNVLIADPGRSSFEKVSREFVEKRAAELWVRSTERPYPIDGRILSIRAPST
ncbi:MAG: class I SAM-dependent methyltransferase [Deltaproteobacteria bacterium]